MRRSLLALILMSVVFFQLSCSGVDGGFSDGPDQAADEYGQCVSNCKLLAPSAKNDNEGMRCEFNCLGKYFNAANKIESIDSYQTSGVSSLFGEDEDAPFEEITIEEWTTFQKFLIVGGAVAIVAATACYLNPVCLLAVYKAFGATFGGITLLTKGVAYGANGAIVAIEGVSPAQFIELSAEFLRLNNLKNPTLFGVARAAEYNRYILDAAARLFGFIK